MIVIVDSNEQATNPTQVKIIQDYLADPRFAKKVKEPVAFAVSHLTAGDINVILNDGRVVAFERKEPNDFLGSIGDGRVFAQVERMAVAAAMSAIIITGSISYDKEDTVLCDGVPTNWKGSAVRAATTAIMWSGCPVLRCVPATLPQVIMETVALAVKPLERFQRRERVVTFPPMDERVEIMSALPGVGPKRAKSILQFVGSNGHLGRLADALGWATMLGAINEESRPEGWGPTTISAVRAALGLKEAEILSVVDTAEAESRGVNADEEAHAAPKEAGQEAK